MNLLIPAIAILLILMGSSQQMRNYAVEVYDEVTNMALSLIKKLEGFRATPYKDTGGRLTIGYGHLIKPGESFSSISEAEAEDLLRADTAMASNAVNSLVSVDLSENQITALTSFVYNIGTGAFQKSTMLRKLNAGDISGAASEFDRWVMVNGVYSQGLANRRSQEKSLFLS